jgi:outer membrane cobalamin receptor
MNLPLGLLTRCIVCGCGALAAMAPLHAADNLTSDDLAGLSLEELLQLEVRVASRIPANTLTAASSVEVIPESVWRRRGARSVSDVLATVPGVSVTPALSGADAFAIRGYTRSTSSVGVLFSWDGVPLNDLFRAAPTLNLPALNLGAVDEIQIVEGPGSALYGADAFHGVVALRPYESAQPEREVYADIRSNDSYSAGTRISNELGDGAQLSVAIAADGQADQHLSYAYADPSTGAPRAGERANEFGAQSVSLKVRGDPAASGSWHAGALLHQYDGDRFQGFGTRLAGVRDVGGVDTDLYLLDGGLRRQWSNNSAFELAAYAWSTHSVLRGGRTLFDFESDAEQSRWGVHGTYERSLPRANTRLAVVVGIEDLSVDEAITRNYALDGSLLLDRLNASSGAERRIYSATFEGQTRWSDDRWRLVYGARSDEYSDFGSQFSPRVGLIWQPDAQNAVKLLYGSAFRAPTANDLRGTPGLIRPNPALEPETVDTRELVVMHQAGTWFLEGTLFHSSWRDGIVSVATVGVPEPFVFMNLERNSSHGVTWKLDWQPDPWRLNVGASWVRSENETAGQPYGAFPRYIVDVEAGYDHARWQTRFYVVQHWQIDTDDAFPPSAGIAAMPIPQYARTDVGAIRAVSPRATLTVTVRNLLDRDNVYPTTSGSRGGIPDYPRTLDLGIRFVY